MKNNIAIGSFISITSHTADQLWAKHQITTIIFRIQKSNKINKYLCYSQIEWTIVFHLTHIWPFSFQTCLSIFFFFFFLFIEWEYTRFGLVKCCVRVLAHRAQRNFTRKSFKEISIILFDLLFLFRCSHYFELWMQICLVFEL